MLRTIATVAALALLLPFLAWSQDASIEEVVVTALRRDVNLYDVADAITVFDRGTIERARIQRLNDVAALTPNLRFSDTQEVGVGTVTIRGVTQNRGIGETPVAYIADGVSVNTSLVTTQDLFDVAQIEVLRGPQGALHGRNAVAGAINITTVAPGEEFEAFTRIRAAQGDDLSAEAAATLPFLDGRLRMRVAGYYQDRDGQLYNATIDRDVDYKESLGLRVRALYDVNDRVALDLR
ncbi:MAG: TonB-dependent receptor plug domain-containing protein [Pseudomonadota bacterium]